METDSVRNSQSTFGKLFFAIVMVTVIALVLRLPFISAGLPYFYDEDEGHHFNRSVNMVKSGDLNPHYFHKPSLHFYLRIPVVAAAFISSVKHGELKSVKEIRTEDSYGLSGFAYSAWPIRIAKWSRAFSVGLSLTMIILSMLIADRLTHSVLAATVTGLISALSPELIKYSPVVGVDILVATMFILAVYVAQLISNKISLGGLIGLGIICGLTVSSKYNAAPIGLLPLIVLGLTREFKPSLLFAAALAPIFGFFIGSPFVLVSLPLFLDHLAYEAWHYAVAGHEGHTGNPGLDQALFYSGWLINDAIGYVAFLIGGAGIGTLLVKRGNSSLVVFLGPILFALFMFAQKANFTRNMLVMVPFFGIGAGYAVWWLAQRFTQGSIVQRFAVVTMVLVLVVQPLISAVELRATLPEQIESRGNLEQWLSQTYQPFSDTALSGQGQFAQSVLKMNGIERFNQALINPIDLFLAGFDRVIYSGQHSALEDKDTLLLSKLFPGSTDGQRIVQNPELRVYGFRDDVSSHERLVGHLATKGTPGITVSVMTKPTEHFSCDYSTGVTHSGEEHCWIQSRIEKINFKNLTELKQFANNDGLIELQLELVSPWPNQRLSLELAKYNQTFQLPEAETGKWQKIKLQLPIEPLLSGQGLLVRSTQVHSPQRWKINEDQRRLAFAIKSVSIAGKL